MSDENPPEPDAPTSDADLLPGTHIAVDRRWLDDVLCTLKYYRGRLHVPLNQADRYRQLDALIDTDVIECVDNALAYAKRWGITTTTRTW